MNASPQKSLEYYFDYHRSSVEKHFEAIKYHVIVTTNESLKSGHHFEWESIGQNGGACWSHLSMEHALVTECR